MLLDDCYRLLELTPDASDEELRKAHRDLSKVWHPDRFAHDPSLRGKAEEKLKQINRAYEAIAAAREGGAPRPGRVTSQGEEMWRLRFWAVTLALLGLFLLFRRPGGIGLVLALAFLLSAVAIVRKMRLLAGRKRR